MNIGFISTRLSGTDGVSLETDKWTELFRKLGHAVFHCAGELDEDSPADSMLVPEMHFKHQDALWVYEHSFGVDREHPELRKRISDMAGYLKRRIEEFVVTRDIQLIIAENILAIPMHVPLAVAMGEYIEESKLPAIGHHHDFYWERERFAKTVISDILEKYFPPRLENLLHVVINSPAKESLKRYKNLDSFLVPNIFDFSRAAPGMDTFNYDLRERLGLTEDNLIILQPTRVVRRKGIEISIELVKELSKPKYRERLMGKKPVLLVTHKAGDEGEGYLRELKELAHEEGVDFRYRPEEFDDSRGNKIFSLPLLHNGYAARTAAKLEKVYSIWDAYVHADFVSYPSRYEGFGNALLEAVYFRLPLLVNRYPIYEKDIRPLGFRVVEISDMLTEDAVDRVIDLMMDPVKRRRAVEWNYTLARKHFSYDSVMATMEFFLKWAEDHFPDELKELWNAG